MSESALFDSDSPMIAQQVAPTSDSINAAVYVRTSPNSRDKEGYSIQEQINSCWERCESLGWKVTHVFRDIDESGRDPDRPQFQQMLRVAEKDAFHVVVVWKLDRFSRSLMHAVSLESDLRDRNVALHSITEFIDTTTPAGRFSFRSIASAAEFERELIKQRTQVGRRAAARNGAWPNGHPPLGYDLDDDNRLLRNEDEAALVERIFRRYLECKSMPQLADELNQEGTTTKKGNEWTKARVQDILSNELYIGRYQVAHVDKMISEYEIIKESLFMEATETRFRFQNGREGEQKSMETSRKEKMLSGIKEQYNDFLSAKFNEV